MMRSTANISPRRSSLWAAEQFNKLVSALRVAMLHMLTWDHQPPLRSRSWVLSIEEQRLEIVDVLADNPGLKPRITRRSRAPIGARVSKRQRRPGWTRRRFRPHVLIRSTTSPSGALRDRSVIPDLPRGGNPE